MKTQKGRSDAAAKPHEFFKSEFHLHHCTSQSSRHNTTQHANIHAERHASSYARQTCPPVQGSEAAITQVMGVASPHVGHPSATQRASGNDIQQPAPSRTARHEARSDSVEPTKHARRMALPSIGASAYHRQHLPPYTTFRRVGADIASYHRAPACAITKRRARGSHQPL